MIASIAALHGSGKFFIEQSKSWQSRESNLPRASSRRDP